MWIYSTESRADNKKNPTAIPMGIELNASDFNVLHASISRPLHSYMIL